MKHKVLILIATFNIGGPGKGIFQLIKNSDKDKVEFVLVNFLTKSVIKSEFLEEAKKYNVLTKVVKQKTRYDLSMIKQVYKIYSENNCTLIQTHGYKAHIIALALKLLYKVKWISFAHGWTSENIRVKIYNSIEKLLIRFPDVAVAVSPKLFSVLKKIRKHKKTELILNAITVPPISDLVEENKIKKKLGLEGAVVLGIFGRLSSEKGQVYAISALAKLSNCKVKLILLGEGVDEEYLRLHAKKLSLQDNVLFCGYQSNIDVYINLVDFIIVPSLSEGIPNIVLEGMAMNKPVISTNVGGIPEIIQHGQNGWLVEPGKPEQISSMLIELLNSKEKVKKITDVAQDSLFPKFSVETRINKFIEIYDYVSNVNSK